MVKHNKLSFENGRLYYKSQELDKLMQKRYKKRNTQQYKIIILTRMDIVQLMIMKKIKGSKLMKMIKTLIKHFSSHVKSNWKIKYNEVYWHEAYEWRKKLHLKTKRFIVYEDKNKQVGGEIEKTQCDLFNDFELIDPSLTEKIKDKGRAILWAKSRSDNKYYAVKIFDSTTADNKKKLLIEHEIKMLQYIAKIRDISTIGGVSKLYNVYKFGDKYTAIVTEALPCSCQITGDKDNCDCSNINLSDVDLYHNKDTIKNMIKMFGNIFKSILFLHENNVVHGDIWRPNIVTNKLNNDMLLIDFGESCLVNINDNSDDKELSCTNATKSGKRRVHIDVLPLSIMKLFINGNMTTLTADMWKDIDIYGIALTMYLLLSTNNNTITEYIKEITLKLRNTTRMETEKKIDELKDTLQSLGENSHGISKQLINALLAEDKESRIMELNKIFDLSDDELDKLIIEDGEFNDSQTKTNNTELGYIYESSSQNVAPTNSGYDESGYKLSPQDQ